MKLQSAFASCRSGALLLVLLCSARAKAQKQDLGNRFEGAFLNHNGEPISILGVLRAPVEFKPGENISVRFFVPSGKPANTSVLVEAQELLPLLGYFMQSKPFSTTSGNTNTFAPWPANAVLTLLEIDPANVAVTASYSDSRGNRIYLPAVARGDNATASNIYTLQFRSSSPMHSLKKVMILPDGKLVDLPTNECSGNASCVLYEANAPHSLQLDMTIYPEGFYKLSLTGIVPNSSPVKATLMFYHRKY